MPRHMRQIIDVFLFNDEEAPLLARYLELRSVVSRFVAIEADLTLSGETRQPKFWSTVEKLGLSASDFTLISITLPKHADPFERERLQRDLALSFIQENFSPDAIMMFSDVDEVPRLEAVRESIPRVSESDSVAFFAQLMCVGWLNNCERTHKLLSFAGEFENVRKRDRKWLGTTMVALSKVSAGMTLSQLRHPETKAGGFRVDNGGWHFSSCGGSLNATPGERISQKLKDFAHVEFRYLSNNPEQIERRLRRGKDVLGRRFIRFMLVNPDSHLSPRLLSDKRFSHLVSWD